MRDSDSGSAKGRKEVTRDNSIIERNKAKLAELAEKKRVEVETKKADEAKKEQASLEASKPPRPFDPNRMSALSQPKPKWKDPNLKKESKPKQISMNSRKML